MLAISDDEQRSGRAAGGRCAPTGILAQAASLGLGRFI